MWNWSVKVLSCSCKKVDTGRIGQQNVSWYMIQDLFSVLGYMIHDILKKKYKIKYQRFYLNSVLTITWSTWANNQIHLVSNLNNTNTEKNIYYLQNTLYLWQTFNFLEIIY